MYLLNGFKEKICFIMLSVFLSSVSCASFLKEEDVLSIKKYEAGIYRLKEDTGEGKFALKKGAKVRLLVQSGDEYIKVYSYPADSDMLKAERTLLVYFFEDDFLNNIFDEIYFSKMLSEKIEKISE